jgi:hypothetical protein
MAVIRHVPKGFFLTKSHSAGSLIGRFFSSLNIALAASTMALSPLLRGWKNRSMVSHRRQSHIPDPIRQPKRRSMHIAPMSHGFVCPEAVSQCSPNLVL